MADIGNTSVISPTDSSNGSGTMPSWLGSAAPSTIDDAGRALQGAVAREWENRSYPTATGTAPAFVVTYTVAPAAYRSGQTYTITAHAAAVGSETLNVNSLGAKNIKKIVAGSKTAIAANDWYTGDKLSFVYDGTDMVWDNRGSSESAASTSASGIVELLTTTELLTGTDTTRAATADSIAALWEAGSDISDGATITIGEGGYFNLITSTTAITAFTVTTDKAGRTFRVRFDTARTLTHNGTSLIIPGAANITTAQGDIAQIRSLGSGNVVVDWYTKASGRPIVGGGETLITSGSFTAVATLDFTSLSTYRSLKLVIKGSRPADDTVAARVYFSSDNGSTWTAANIDTGVFVLTGTTVTGLSVANNDYYALNGDDTGGTGSIGNAAGEGIWGTLEIGGFNQAAQKPMKSSCTVVDEGTATYQYIGSGFDDSTTAFDAIRFQYDSGNIAAVGTYELWGVVG